MSLSTEELRAALDEASSAPYDAASSARLAGVRARVQRRQRTRAAAAAGVGVLAVVTAVAVAANVSAGGGRSPLTPATSSTPSTATAALAPLPLLYRGQDVVAELTGTYGETPAKLVTFPAGTGGAIVVRCAALKGAVLDENTAVIVTAEFLGDDEAPAPASITCAPDGEPADSDILGTVDLKAGATLRLQARFDRPVPAGSTFSVALLGGDDVIDLSPLRAAPKGYTFMNSFALSNGWLYASGTADSSAETPAGNEVLNGAEIAMADKRSVHLLVYCIGRQQLVADLGDGEQQTVDCPVDQRVSRTVDLTPRPSAEQRLRLEVRDADPGALVEVGVSAR
ncbi:hypothetical protein ACPPVT_06875 [Angustibacter sp. McL0619]|uniref:hypothetical protein n=1 Tax=Angustibacter sp. McL0619 TaxID=3415676 RepID=UPI003CF5B51D